MKICGLKLTHDSAIAVIENGKLIFSTEIEKIANGNRFAIIDDLDTVETHLCELGYTLNDFDHLVIDGWVGQSDAFIKTHRQQIPLTLPVAPYHEKNKSKNILQNYHFNEYRFAPQVKSYESYTHVAGHIASAYCTSPFAKKKESAYILIWDGGMYPRLYFYNPNRVHTVNNLGPLFYLVGNIYAIFAQYFRPFKINENVLKDELSIAGKIMAFTALGKMDDKILQALKDTYKEHLSKARALKHMPNFAYEFARAFIQRVKGCSFNDADIITSFHHFLEQMLVQCLRLRLNQTGRKSENLCYGGGAALNIKWNTSIRNSGLFKNIWICPFPNDSGSAIGAACCQMMASSTEVSLDWNVYSGPNLIKNAPSSGWTTRACSITELAALLHSQNEPCIFMHGKAELGPRALGNRSILAAATVPHMKNLLNIIKMREHYRPVAPICLEKRAPEFFSPGCPDPYMLFQHEVRSDWAKKLPAISHIDGTARLQTVSGSQHPLLYELLTEYEEISGSPILCNTSANYKGSGFFPDIYSATAWGQVNYIWADSVLFEKTEKIKFI